MNYLQQITLALAKTGDTEMVQLLRCFSARLNVVLAPREIETYARYLLAPGAQTARAPATAAEQAVWNKIQADHLATTLSQQIVAGLATRKRAAGRLWSELSRRMGNRKIRALVLRHVTGATL